jgi:hypothetical protein
MKNLVFKMFLLLALLLLSSKSFAQCDFYWNNTSSCGALTVNVYDASNTLLLSSATCCTGVICISGIPSRIDVTDGTCTYSTTNFSGTAFQPGLTGCSCGGFGVLWISAALSGGGTCLPGANWLTVTIL